jgi:hypothetical protein
MAAALVAVEDEAGEAEVAENLQNLWKERFCKIMTMTFVNRLWGN